MIQKSLSHIFALFAFCLRFSFFVAVFGFLSVGLLSVRKISVKFWWGTKKKSELGTEENRGARSGNVKNGRSAERRCQKAPERGAIFTPGWAPYLTI